MHAPSALAASRSFRSRVCIPAALLAAALFAAPSAKASITINGTSYSSGVNLNTANATWTITGTASGYVQVKQNCTIVLDNVTWTDSTTKTDAIQITDGLTVNLQLKGANKITCSASDGKQTGIRVTAVYGTTATAAVGTKAPNAWGLYDMHGNVAEWCHDMSTTRTADAADLGASAATDPTGVEASFTTPYRLLRGGEFDSTAGGGNLRSARRRARQQADTSVESGQNYIGFRVAAREFAGQATVGSRIDAAGTATATLGRTPSRATVISVF